MMVSTTSRYQPFTSPTATPPHKILAQGDQKNILVKPYLV